jgi:hypothetical protein
VQETEHKRALAAENGGQPFVPVKHRTGFMGIFGKLVASKQYYHECIRRCEKEIDDERQYVFKDGYARSYFVVFETQVRISDL